MSHCDAASPGSRDHGPDSPRGAEKSPLTTTPSDDRRAAEEALWLALKEWATNIKRGGLKLSLNHLDWMGQAHRERRLIDELNKVMEEEADHNSSEFSSRHAHQMAETLDHGLEVWEQVLIR